jgi:hypothetical protein
MTRSWLGFCYLSKTFLVSCRFLQGISQERTAILQNCRERTRIGRFQINLLFLQFSIGSFSFASFENPHPAHSLILADSWGLILAQEMPLLSKAHFSSKWPLAPPLCPHTSTVRPAEFQIAIGADRSLKSTRLFMTDWRLELGKRTNTATHLSGKPVLRHSFCKRPGRATYLGGAARNKGCCLYPRTASGSP